MSVGAPLVTVRGLTCRAGDQALFTGFDLDLAAGQLVEVWGPNGSGKSTLLKTLAGLLPSEPGEVTREGGVLYLGHRLGLNGLLTPLENLAWYAALEGGSSTAPERLEALNRIGLARDANRPCHTLSQGQQRRASLARLAISRARTWLLDEPLTALDDQGADVVRGWVVDRCRDAGGVIVATHQRLDIPTARVVDLGELERR